MPLPPVGRPRAVLAHTPSPPTGRPLAVTACGSPAGDFSPEQGERSRQRQREWRRCRAATAGPGVGDVASNSLPRGEKKTLLLTSILYNSASFAMLPCHGNLMQGLTYRSVPVYRVHLGTGTILVPGDMHSAARDPQVLATRERRRRASDDGARARTARER
ncbi:hypothetical protein GW17_00029497 [Ensete ventricosum]|nr:hypothetical protein GW17_00029497 [Ensete ventricosum]